MTSSFEGNSHPDRGAPLLQADSAALGIDVVSAVRAYARLWRNHKATPLISRAADARALGVASIDIKDESTRFHLGSFKALGGSYAVMRLLAQVASRELSREIGPHHLDLPEVRSIAANLTVGCATDGNHGRSVAAGAQLMGCRAVIFVHENVSAERVAAIARFGANVIRVPGIYDDAVAEAEHRCNAEGWTIVSDTSWPGYETIPLWVMQGYTLLVDEVLAAMQQPPTHVFLQAGVGGFAAAVAAHLTLVLGDRCPRIVVVEPDRAACLYASNRAGRAVKIPHGQPTVMAMMECYEPSLIAWRILTRLAEGYMTVTDEDAAAAMRQLAEARNRDTSIIAGESGAAGYAGLVCLAADPATRAALAIDHSARILLVNTEGATDEETYRRLVGRASAKVAAQWEPAMARQ